jgi:cell division protein FtsN
MRRQVRKSSGAAGLFVLLGFLTILGVTFLAGTYAGRIWATKPHAGASASAEREPKLRGGDVRVPRITEPAPRLTFYQELTAPLTAPPPPPKPAKTTAPPLVAAHPPRPAMPEKFQAEKAARDATAISTRPPTGQADLALPATTAATAISTRPATGQAGLALPATTAATRFTVQVGAYRLRPPADALRATLTAAGHDARVVETDAPNGVRFRVQIGDFASREAARDAAVRLPGPTFVTTR